MPAPDQTDPTESPEVAEPVAEPVDDHEPPRDAYPAGTRRSWMRWARLLGYGVGIAMLAGVFYIIAREWSELQPLLNDVPIFSWATWLLALCVLSNVILTGLMFSVLKSRYGRVGVWEMQLLIAAATLLNFLPLRPGLIGRMAYHKVIHEIRVIDSMKVLLEASVISVILAIYIAGAIFVVAIMPMPLWLPVLVPLPLMLGLAGRRIMRRYMLALAIRHVELLIWAARYYLAFHLLNLPIEWEVALVLACISSVATMIPLFSNGLGIREWSIGIAAPLLTDHALKFGLTAELVNRAVEIVVVLICGSIALVLLNQRRKRQKHNVGRTP